MVYWKFASNALRVKRREMHYKFLVCTSLNSYIIKLQWTFQKPLSDNWKFTRHCCSFLLSHSRTGQARLKKKKQAKNCLLKTLARRSGVGWKERKSEIYIELTSDSGQHVTEPDVSGQQVCPLAHSTSPPIQTLLLSPEGDISNEGSCQHMFLIQLHSFILNSNKLTALNKMNVIKAVFKYTPSYYI